MNIASGCLGREVGEEIEWRQRQRASWKPTSPDIELCIDNLLVRVHCIIEMVRWNGLAPWEFEFPFPGILTSTFLDQRRPRPEEQRSALLEPEERFSFFVVYFIRAHLRGASLGTRLSGDMDRS